MRFNIVTWISKTKATVETLTLKLDGVKDEPEVLEDGGKMKIGSVDITTEEEWCSEQLYQLLVQKTEGAALSMVRNLSSQGQARSVVAW